MKARLKRMIAMALSVIMVLTAFVLPSPVKAAETNTAGSIQAEFFVDPVEGSDENDGSYEHPFATVEAARDAVRKVNDDMTGDIYVFLAAGEYYMDETLAFTEEDSGTNGYKVVYRNLDGLGSAELIGGQKVTSEWELVAASDDPTNPDSDLPASAVGKVYKTNVGTALGGDSINTKYVNDDGVFYTLYVNDQRATLARTQNRDNSSGFTSALTPYMRSANGGVGDLYYKSGDLDQDTINGLVNAQARGDLNASVYMWDGGYWDWMTDTIPVSAIETGSNRLVYKTVDGHAEVYRPKYATRNNARYFLQGNLGMLDVAGEYYYNSVTGDLYYYPEGDIADQEIVIPYVQEIIRVEGTSKDSKVHDIEFSGLTIKDADHTEWYAYGWNWGDAGNGLGFYPDAAAGSTQPSYCEQTERVEFQYGNITLVNTDSISITNSRIKNSGMFGIELYLANTNARIENCVIEYTAHGGINFDGGYPGVAGDENGDGYSRDNTVYNCLIHDIGELVGQASGFTIQQSGYNTVSHVEIYNSPRRGVFLTAGYSRNGGTAYPDGDANYDPMTDLYTHHNNIEYVYLHDCQQDGGDDGAFFACYLYRGFGTPYKPNYVNQMVVENVAANPSMTDIAPNGINLDMGCSGMELHNVKVVNPQHFNIEAETTTSHGGVIVYDNVNIDFGSHTNHLAEFDDSKMEYDQIGLTVDFPAEYKPAAEAEETLTDVYFSEDFENGIDYNKWSAKGTPAITTEWMSEGALAGRQSLMINSDSGKPVLYREFAEDLNKVVSVKLFDRAGFNLCSYSSGVSINASITTYARVDDGEHVVAMGIDNAVGGGSDGVYVLQVGDQKIKTDIGRFFGWHELKWDYSSGKQVDLYFDGQLVKTLTEADGVSMDFNYVALGSETGSGVTFFDELNIYGGKPAGDPGAVDLPEIPPYEQEDQEEEEEETPAGTEMPCFDFEDGKTIEGNINAVNTTQQVKDSGDETHGKVLELTCTDGALFFENDAEWTDYTLDLDLKFDNWINETSDVGNNLGGFGIFVRTMVKDKPNNPDSYQLVYRHNLNNSGWIKSDFPSGTPYLEVAKRYNSVDTHPLQVAVPEGLDVTDWNHYQVRAEGNTITLSINGVQVLSLEDAGSPQGGIGFGGWGAVYEIDNVKMAEIREPDLFLDFEDGNAIDGNINAVNTTQQVKDSGDETHGNVLELTCTDGALFYETGAEWTDYTLDLDLKFDNWINETSDVGNNLGGFGIYVRTLVKDKPNNPDSYQLVYRHNLNNSGWIKSDFPSGTPYLEVAKRFNSYDTHPLQVAVPEGLDVTDWNHYQVRAEGNTITLSINGVQVLSLEDAGSPQGGIAFGGWGVVYEIDNVTLMLDEAEQPEEEQPKEQPENGSAFFADFEDGNGLDFYFTTDDTSRLSQEVITEEGGNNVLKFYAGDGHAFYNTNAEWENYLVNFKWKFGGWGDKNVLDFAYDNFTCYVMTTSDGSTKQNNNPPAYQVVYRRNKNGSGEFAAGTPYFEICKHTPSSDISLGKVAVPEGFNELEWHDFQIQTFDGKVGFVIDGQKLISIDDGQYTHGGLGFGGINYTCYLDDIEVIVDPVSVKYSDTLGLDNIEINGKFNPNYYNYFVRVADPTKPVNFTMPEVIVDGTQVTVTLNGSPVTENGALDLVNGVNTLEITEKAIAGDKVYTVTIQKDVKVTGIETIASSVTTQLGVAPVLPAKTTATFADGSTQEVAINWKQIHPKQYQKTGSFTVKGSLDGFDYPVEITVTVHGLTGVETLPQVTTTVNVAPELAKTLTAHCSDGDKQLPLTFDTLDASLYAQPGVIFAVGTADGYAYDVLQKVVVEGIPVDKTALEALVEDAEALNEDDYTEETWSDLAEALAAAKGVLADEDATQEDVDSAYDALDAAMKALEAKPVVDKSALEALVEEAEALNEDDYTEETWNDLAEALADAKDVLADEDATQDDVDQALEALQAAIDGLREKPEPEPEPEVDKSALEDLYNDNKDKQQGDYTDDSWEDFQEALANAEAVLNDPNATQEEVDAAKAALRAAIDGLQVQEKPTFPVLPIIPGGSNTTKPTEEMPFTDVNTGDRFYNDVKYVYENGIMNGVSDTRFAPQSTLTRAMVVTILYRMEGEPSTRYNALFPDVTDNQWYTKGVEWAANNGIVLGYTSGKFGPNDPVTREQLAAILYRYAQSKNYVLAEGSDLSAFADASNVSPYAVTAVQWSVTERLLEGSNGKLLPRQNATRAEVAHAIAGFCQNVGK